MKYLIAVSLLFGFILFPDDVKAVLTKDSCIACCNGLTDGKDTCIFACNQKFSMSQDYNSRNSCNRSCRPALGGCQQACFDDCAERYEEIPPGRQAPTRRMKQKRADREAREAAGLYTRWRSTKDPNEPKKKYKPRKKKDDDEGGSSAPVG